MNASLLERLERLQAQRESDPNYEAARATEKQIRERLGVSTKSSLMIDFVLRGGELAFARLGIDYRSTVDQAKAAYRSASVGCHPDRGGSQSEMAKLNAQFALVKSYLEAAHS